MKDLFHAMIANSIQTENIEISDTSHLTEIQKNDTIKVSRFNVNEELQSAEKLKLYWQKVRREKILFGNHMHTDFHTINYWHALAERTIDTLKRIR